MKPIGILGGMGPEASADVYLQIIHRSYRFAAENMDSYPHIFINNIPKPNIFQHFDPETGRYLGEQARILEVAGAKAIGVACNSAHYFWADMRAAVSQQVWLVDMIDEVAKKVAGDGFHQIGILSSSMSRPLYLQAAENHRLQVTLLPKPEQEKVDQIISQILAGERTPALKAELCRLADGQIARQAQCVILGCTDLPIILKQTDVSYPLFASNDILAEVLFNFAVSEERAEQHDLSA
jgi:aspartate racemase